MQFLFIYCCVLFCLLTAFDKLSVHNCVIVTLATYSKVFKLQRGDTDSKSYAQVYALQ